MLKAITAHQYGPILINILESNIKLTEESRKMLKEVVVTHYLNIGETMGMEQFKEVADLIGKVFNDDPVRKLEYLKIFRFSVFILLLYLGYIFQALQRFQRKVQVSRHHV